MGHEMSSRGQERSRSNETGRVLPHFVVNRQRQTIAVTVGEWTKTTGLPTGVPGGVLDYLLEHPNQLISTRSMRQANGAAGSNAHGAETGLKRLRKILEADMGLARGTVLETVVNRAIIGNKDRFSYEFHAERIEEVARDGTVSVRDFAVESIPGNRRRISPDSQMSYD